MTRDTVEVAVVIPTWARGDLVFRTLEEIASCVPGPREIWVHVDQTDGKLEAELAERFPDVRTIGSTRRIGPGGGRDACLRRTSCPIAVSFDDDSWPIDQDFFARVWSLFDDHPDAAVIGASIWHPHQDEPDPSDRFRRKLSFTGCGFAIRVSAYRDTTGYVPRPVAYGIEETDIALQLFAHAYPIYESGQLRVFHNTELKHHQTPDIVANVVANVALLAFLRYPIWLWSWALLQIASTVAYNVRTGRFRGIARGLTQIPSDCWQFSGYRHVLSGGKVWAFLQARRAER